jgi:hypothetical protein
LHSCSWSSYADASPGFRWSIAWRFEQARVLLTLVSFLVNVVTI